MVLRHKHAKKNRHTAVFFGRTSMQNIIIYFLLLHQTEFFQNFLFV